MYNNNHIFYPKNIYTNIDFESIKKDIKKANEKYEDYGSIIILDNLSWFLSINNLGKVQLFYDTIDEESIKNTVKNIEKIFKKQIDEFEIALN